MQRIGDYVFADFVKNVVNNENIIMKSDGNAVRAFCYIRDAVDGYFRVMFNGQRGEAYNIGTDVDVVSIKELANIVAGLFPERKISVIYDIPDENKNYLKSTVIATHPDISKARKLGFDPKVRITEGFKRTIISYL